MAFESRDREVVETEPVVIPRRGDPFEQRRWFLGRVASEPFVAFWRVSGSERWFPSEIACPRSGFPFLHLSPKVEGQR